MEKGETEQLRSTGPVKRWWWLGKDGGNGGGQIYSEFKYKFQLALTAFKDRFNAQ